MTQVELPIYTERLILRPVNPEDLKAFHEMYSDPEIAKYSCDTDSIEVSERHVARSIQKFERNGYGVVAMTLKSDASVIGYCNSQRSPLESPNEYEITYAVHPNWRRRGYAAEAIRSFIPWALAVHKTDRIVARVKPYNHASSRTLISSGFNHTDTRKDPLDPTDIEDIWVFTEKDDA